MIDFRYHVVSIVAVFLALAIGLFVGSTSLQGTVFDTIKGKTDSVAHKNAQLNQQIAEQDDELAAGQRFDAALEPYAVADRLAGQSVVVVSLPGVDGGLRRDTVQALTDAGATVTADVRVQAALLDPQQDAFLTSLTKRLEVPVAATGGTGLAAAAAQLAEVLTERPGGRATPAPTVQEVLGAYRNGNLISVQSSSGDTVRPASLGLVLTGAPPSPPPTPAAGSDGTGTDTEHAFVAAFAGALDSSALGAVVAGPTAAGDAGDVAAAAHDATLARAVSTVSGLDQVAGRIAVVFALARQVDGVTGNYGIGASASTPLPTASASASP